MNREGEDGRDGFEPVGVRESAPRLDPFPLSRGSLNAIVSATAAALAAAPIAAAPTNPDPAAAIAEAARLLLPDLEHGHRIDAAMLRAAMERAFGGSDAEGAWDWKTAYDACEAATVLFLRKFGPAMRAKAASPAAMLPMLTKIAGLLPTHTRRSEESQAFQQFSTPIPLGFAARTAAAITPADLRAGALGRHRPPRHPRRAGRRRARPQRAGRDPRRSARPALSGLSVTRFDAAQIDDHLDAGHARASS